MQKAALTVSGLIFAAGAIGHLARLIAGFDIVVAGYSMPLWVSIIGVLAAGALAIWMFAAARRA